MNNQNNSSASSGDEKQDAGRVMMRAHAFCPSELSHPDKMRWIGKFFLAHYQPPAGLAKTSTQDDLEEAFACLLTEHTSLSTDGIDECVPRMVAAIPPEVLPYKIVPTEGIDPELYGYRVGERAQGGLAAQDRVWIQAAINVLELGGNRITAASLSDILSRQSMMGGEIRAEIDERAEFEKFMSKRGWAAVYAGDGQYESPSVQDQWEAWQARAAIAAPQQQAEHDDLLAEAHAVFDLMLDGCLQGKFGDFENGRGETIGPRMDALHARLRALASIPANAAAANGDGRKPDAWLVPSILSFEDRRTSCPVELVGQLEGTVAWEAALFSDGDIDAVTDKHGVEHKPIPLYRVAADADGQKVEAK